MRFAKAHGLGNDFVLVGWEHCPGEAAPWARRLCDRHLGIGGDGVLVFAVDEGRLRMRLLNADGSDGDVSGNGVRCLAAYAVEKGWVASDHVVETPVGPRAVTVDAAGGSRFRVGTDLGPAILASAAIPVALDPPRERVVGYALEAAGQAVVITATSLGNPHCALFLDAPAEDDLVLSLGPALEHHPFFPRRTNVEFVTPLSRDRLRVRFWERGVGYTRASGTGAASAAVAAILNGRAERRVSVVCDGGTLEVEWPEGGTVCQTGEVELLFEGEWRIPR
ncbi:MAG TPA: diaminopimelate epimerase [Vicinamibacteria bacterium]|nr:diaminopimelate epimerase [Vicinamibacteria bacterium]